MATEVWATNEAAARRLLGLSDPHIKLQLLKEQAMITGILARFCSTSPRRLYSIVRTSNSLVVG